MAVPGLPRSEMNRPKKAAHLGYSGTATATCNGKEQYNRATANLVVRKTKKIKLNAYLCPFCKHWHIGNNEKEK